MRVTDIHLSQQFPPCQSAERPLVRPVPSVASHSPDLVIICVIEVRGMAKTTQNSLLVVVKLNAHAEKAVGEKDVRGLEVFFKRLDTHLRKSATCMNPCPSTQHFQQHNSQDLQEDKPSQQTSIEADTPQESSATPECFKRRESLVLPATPEEWLEANELLATKVIPVVLAIPTLELKMSTCVN